MKGLLFLTLLLVAIQIATGWPLSMIHGHAAAAETPKAEVNVAPPQPVVPVASPAPAPALPPIPSTRDIANVYQQAGGCESTAHHETIGIPDYDRLDPTYQGVVSGIEFRENTHVGSAGYRNVSFQNGSLGFDLYSDGKGAKNTIPFVGEKCIGAEGASIGYTIVAHYK